MKKKATFHERLRKLRKDNKFNQIEMGFLFGIGREMYQKLETARYFPKEETMSDYLKLLDKFEKETDLQKYLVGIQRGVTPSREGVSTNQVDYLLEENKLLKDEVRSLKARADTDQLTIKFLYEEISKLKAQLAHSSR